jgi:hypothetical protein
LASAVAAGAGQEPASLISDGHAAGLFVHAWIGRNDNAFPPIQWDATPGALATTLC